VVNPNIGGGLDPETVAVCSKDILADDVAYNDISLLPDE
jgi:hypothetical protein